MIFTKKIDKQNNNNLKLNPSRGLGKSEEQRDFYVCFGEDHFYKIQVRTH